MSKNTKKKTEITPVEKRAKLHRVSIIRTALFTTAFGVLACTVVGLSVALYYANQTIATNKVYYQQMNSLYSRSYYDLIDGAKDIGVTLRKIGVSNSKDMQQALLFDVWRASELAEENLSVFECNGEGMLRAQKFVNQLGDFAHSVAIRMKDGKPLSKSERDILEKFSKMAKIYKQALDDIQINEDGMTFLDNGGLEDMSSAFDVFIEPSFEYPEMIYDGPFSSSLEHPTPKGLKGEDIDKDKGKQIIGELFDNHNIKDVEYMGDSLGNVHTLNYSLTIDDENAYIQLSKKGGMLVSYNGFVDYDKTINDFVDTSLTDAHISCEQKAVAFAKKMGYDNMHVVWSTSSNGECIVNLAPIIRDVIIYPDLIKVKLVDSESTVVGFDATHYALNHHDREIATPSITVKEAKRSLSIPTQDEGRLALIPMHATKEILTYEFECEQDGTYYIYVDALTGEEVNILYVIDDGTGQKTI